MRRPVIPTGLVRPTMDEWARAVDFLTRTGQRCDDKRQEFILLSDVLGVSMLLETINSRKTAGAPGVTAATVLGPFHLVASPRRELGDSIDLVGGERPCVITGQVRNTLGAPLPGPEVDVWQGNEQGFYDVQQPDSQPPGNGRDCSRPTGRGAFGFGPLCRVTIRSPPTGRWGRC
ncbi:MAG TPA: dioxygenase [Streptosporangiaceae bacterium]